MRVRRPGGRPGTSLARLRLLRGVWPVVALVTLAVPAVVLAISASLPHRYVTGAQMEVLSPAVTLSTRRALGVGTPVQGLPFTDAALEADPQALKAIARRAETAAGESAGPPLAGRVHVAAGRPGVVALAESAGRPIPFSVLVIASSPARAAREANAWTASYLAVRRVDLDRRIARAQAARRPGHGSAPSALDVVRAEELGNVVMRRRARPPSAMASPRIGRDLVAGILLGLVAGAIVASRLLRTRRPPSREGGLEPAGQGLAAR